VPLDQLLAALERAAQEQAERVVADARTEAERISANAEQETARRRDTAVGSRERELRAALEQALSKSRRAARREVLEARDRLLARVFAAAREALPAAIETPAYRAALPQRVAAALSCLDPGEQVVLRCTSSLAETLATEFSGKPGISVREDVEVGSGFRLGTVDGSVEVDDTLETRLAARRAALAREALRRLGVEREP
jgi:vacuolar-type H+-ATPase subunit E/Vma4